MLCRAGIHLRHRGAKVPKPLWQGLPLRWAPNTKGAGEQHVPTHSCPSPAGSTGGWWKREGSIHKEILTGWQFIFLLPEQGQHLSPYDFKSHCVPISPGSGRAALTQLRAAAGRAVRQGGCVGHSWAMAHLVNMAVRYYQHSQEFKSDRSNSTREPQSWVSNAKTLHKEQHHHGSATCQQQPWGTSLGPACQQLPAQGGSSWWAAICFCLLPHRPGGKKEQRFHCRRAEVSCPGPAFRLSLLPKKQPSQSHHWAQTCVVPHNPGSQYRFPFLACWVWQPHSWEQEPDCLMMLMASWAPPRAPHDTGTLSCPDPQHRLPALLTWGCCKCCGGRGAGLGYAWRWLQTQPKVWGSEGQIECMKTWTLAP